MARCIVFWIVGGYIAIVAGWVGICMFPGSRGRAYAAHGDGGWRCSSVPAWWLAVKVGGPGCVEPSRDPSSPVGLHGAGQLIYPSRKLEPPFGTLRRSLPAVHALEDSVRES